MHKALLNVPCIDKHVETVLQLSKPYMYKLIGVKIIKDKKFCLYVSVCMSACVYVCMSVCLYVGLSLVARLN